MQVTLGRLQMHSDRDGITLSPDSRDDLMRLGVRLGTDTRDSPRVPLRPLRILRWSFSIGVQGALFSDLGTAWDRQEELTPRRFRAGYGLGLRFIVPNAEMLRLDVGCSAAHGLFHFGAWSKSAAQRLRLR